MTAKNQVKFLIEISQRTVDCLVRKKWVKEIDFYYFGCGTLYTRI